jgi:hypothetical protein
LDFFAFLLWCLCVVVCYVLRGHVAPGHFVRMAGGGPAGRLWVIWVIWVIVFYCKLAPVAGMLWVIWVIYFS